MSRMEIIDLIRNADSVPKVLSALSAYTESLRHLHTAAIPEWLLRLPLKGADDVAQRMTALTAVVNLSSQNLRVRDTSIAKTALRVYAAAAWRLRKDERRDAPPN